MKRSVSGGAAVARKSLTLQEDNEPQGTQHPSKASPLAATVPVLGNSNQNGSAPRSLSGHSTVARSKTTPGTASAGPLFGEWNDAPGELIFSGPALSCLVFLLLKSWT